MEQFVNEIWKPIKENPIYQVSNWGRVKCIAHPVWNEHNKSYSTRKEHYLSLNNCNTKKYWRVGLQVNGKQRLFAVHRLVAEAFIPNPNNLLQVNHIDGNKDHNYVENLEWCDNDYNMKHAIQHGLIHGEEERKKQSLTCNMRKLTEEQVFFIKKMFSTIDTKIKGEQKRFCLAIQKLFHLKSSNTVFWIIKGGTNKFTNQDIVQTSNYNTYLEEYRKLYDFYKPKKMIKEYAEELNVNPDAFYGRYRKLGKNIEATIQYYKNKYHIIGSENCSSKENIAS